MTTERVTIPDVLSAWRKYYLAIRPATPVRHATTGEFGITVGPAWNRTLWQVKVKLNESGEEFDTNYDKLYPAWWPDSEWPWFQKSQAR